MGKLVIKLIQSGSRLASDAIQTRRQRRDPNYAVPSSPSSLPLEERDRLVLADEEIAKSLIREGRAELPAEEDFSLHQQYAELPAAEGPSVHAQYVELPADLGDLSQSCHVKMHCNVYEGAAEIPFDRQDLQRHAELNNSVNMENVRLPTYEESEWAPVAFSNTQPNAASGVHERRDVNESTAPNQATHLGATSQSLPYPVVIPHCSFGAGTPGFQRLYAPDLQACGISHESFSRFLDDLNQFILDAGFIETITVAAGSSQKVPEIAPFLTGLMVEVAAGTAAREMQFSWDVNSFLDWVNQQMFMPCGLYAVVMQFKDTVFAHQAGQFGGISQRLNKSLFMTERIDVHSPPSSTAAVFEIPHMAQLFSLDLDGTPAEDAKYQPNDTRGSHILKTIRSIHEARQPRNNPDTHAPRQRGLLSAYRDSNHHGQNDRLITKLSGGRLGTRPGLIERAATSIKETHELRRKNREEGRAGQSGNCLDSNVPYLVIVNIPSEQELQKSVARLETVLL